MSGLGASEVNCNVNFPNYFSVIKCFIFLTLLLLEMTCSVHSIEDLYLKF